jgi:hypothetical protein
MGEQAVDESADQRVRPGPTVYGLFRSWRCAGVFAALMVRVIAEAEAGLSLVGADSTANRATATSPGRVSARLRWMHCAREVRCHLAPALP